MGQRRWERRVCVDSDEQNHSAVGSVLNVCVDGDVQVRSGVGSVLTVLR